MFHLNLETFVNVDYAPKDSLGPVNDPCSRCRHNPPISPQGCPRASTASGSLRVPLVLPTETLAKIPEKYSSQQSSASSLIHQAGNCSVFSTGSQSCPGVSAPSTHRATCLTTPPAFPASLLHSPTCAPWLSSQINCLLWILVSGSASGEIHTKTTLIWVYVFCLFVC